MMKMMTNSQTYAQAVEPFLEQVAVYLQQLDHQIGEETPRGIVSHFDYKLPFKENPKKVRDLDLLTLNVIIKQHKFSEENVGAWVTKKGVMRRVRYSQFNNQNNGKIANI